MELVRKNQETFHAHDSLINFTILLQLISAFEHSVCKIYNAVFYIASTNLYIHKQTLFEHCRQKEKANLTAVCATELSVIGGGLVVIQQ